MFRNGERIKTWNSVSEAYVAPEAVERAYIPGIGPHCAATTYLKNFQGLVDSVMQTSHRPCVTFCPQAHTLRDRNLLSALWLVRTCGHSLMHICFSTFSRENNLLCAYRYTTVDSSFCIKWY